MKPWHTLDTATPKDGKPLVLQQRDGVYVIRVGGQELMSSATHGSEQAMAEIGLLGQPVGQRRVLIGGLGLGYTLRAVLDALSPNEAAVVVELSEAVVAWNRGVLAPLAAAPLMDPRVRVELGDIGAFMTRTTERFHAILLDVDNGPVALTHAANGKLYQPTGLAAFRQRLHPGGALVVWSASPDDRFAKSLANAGFRVDIERVPTRPGAKARHVLFVGRTPGTSQP